MKKIIALKNKFEKLDKKVLIILLISILVLAPIFSQYYIQGHDTYYHYSNIYVTTENMNLSKFKLLPDKVLPIIANDFGWGEGIFYPQLPHYSTALIHKLLAHFNFELLSTMNTIHLIVLFLSGVSMYYLAKKLSKNKYAALISATTYITFPYLFHDITIRDAYNESYLFIFIPLIYLGIEYLFEKNYKNFYIFFIIGYVGCITSHLTLSIYITIFTIIYLLINIKKILTNILPNLKAFIISSIIILLLTSPFLIPLIEHTVLGNYTVYSGNMWSNKEFATINLYDFLNLNPKYLNTYFTISIIALTCNIFVYINYKNTKHFNNIKNYIPLILLAIISTTNIIPWKKLPTFLLSIQMAWRLNILVVFYTSLITGFIIHQFKQSYQKNITIIILILAVLNIENFYKYSNITDLKNKSIINTVDITNHGKAADQYIPTNAHKHKKYYETRTKNVIVKKGYANITNLKSKTPYLTFKINNPKKNTILELPRYYFLGYKITLNDKPLKYKENNKGFIEIKISKPGNIKVTYEGTIGYKISYILVTIAIIIIITYLKRTRKITYS